MCYKFYENVKAKNESLSKEISFSSQYMIYMNESGLLPLETTEPKMQPALLFEFIITVKSIHCWLMDKVKYESFVS